MKRRAVLAALGTAALAGCSSKGPSDSPDEQNQPRQNRQTTSGSEPNPNATFSESILSNGSYEVQVDVQLRGAEQIVIQDSGASEIATITSSGTHTVATGLSAGTVIQAVVSGGIAGDVVNTYGVGSQKQPTYPTQLMGLSGSTLPDESVEGMKSRTYTQTVNGIQTELSTTIPTYLYQYYADRVRFQDYGAYVSDRFDQAYTKDLVEQVQQYGDQNGLSDRQVIDHLVAIVQNMEYTQDKAATGYNEYPKFPAETLVDRGGDCEDSCILLSQMLSQMGYGSVLLILPGAQHMALGVAGDESLPGQSYTYEGQEYYYLETTAGGWDIGEVPRDVRESGSRVKFSEVNSSPVLAFAWSISANTSGAGGANTEVAVRNVGDAPATNASVQVNFEDANGNRVAQRRKTLPTIAPKNITTQTVSLQPPADKPLRAHIQLGIDGVLHDEDKSGIQEPLGP